MENSLNRKYEHFFAKRNEFVTQTSNCFNYIINNMRGFDIFKHESLFVLKFLESIDNKWELHLDVLKNNKKIHSMDLNSMYRNMESFEEIIKESFKENSSALFIRKSRFIPDSDSDKFDNVDSEKDLNTKFYSCVVMIMKNFEKSGNK